MDNQVKEPDNKLHFFCVVTASIEEAKEVLEEVQDPVLKEHLDEVIKNVLESNKFGDLIIRIELPKG